MRRSFQIAAIAAFLVTLVVGGLWGDRLLALSDDARDGLRLYTELVTLAHDRYGAEVTYKDLIFSSVEGMLRTLDPHTNFLPPEAYTGMREKQQASFYGLGILVGSRNSQLTVISPIEGTPASRMGVQAGDVPGCHCGRVGWLVRPSTCCQVPPPSRLRNKPAGSTPA